MNFFSLLTIAFIVLKLTDAIDWAWWWVLSPFAGHCVAFVLIEVLESWAKKREQKSRREPLPPRSVRQ